MQDHPIKLDLPGLLDNSYEHMHSQYLFCFPGDGGIELGRAHPSFSRIGTTARRIANLCELANLPQRDPLHAHCLAQIEQNALIILEEKDWAYPSGNLSEQRIASALNCLNTCIKNYSRSLAPFAKAAFQEPASFDALRHYCRADISSTLRYAYPNDEFDPGRGHACAQSLLSFVEFEIQIADHLRIGTDPELAEIAHAIKSGLRAQKSTLMKIYPGNYYDNGECHISLMAFQRQWKSLSEAARSSLRGFYASQGFDLEEGLDGVRDPKTAPLSKRSASF